MTVATMLASSAATNEPTMTTATPTICCRLSALHIGANVPHATSHDRRGGYVLAVMIPIALAVVYVVWGSTYFAIALVVQTMPPIFTAGVRQLIAGAIVALWVVARQRDAFRLSRREIFAAASTGVLLLAGGNGLVMVGERTVPSGLAALI